MLKRNIVIFSFILGVILIIVSFFLFSYKIPITDMQLNAKEKKFISLKDSYYFFELRQLGDIVTHQNMFLLSAYSPNSTLSSKLDSDLQQIRLQQIIQLRYTSTGELTTQEFMNQFNGMDNEELRIEAEKLFILTPPFLTKFSGEISELNNKKQIFLRWAVITQIVGLIFIHFATIYQIKRK